MKQVRSNAYSRAAKARWDDPVIGSKIRAALRDPSVRAKVREATKAQWADPEMRTKMISGMKAARERRRKADIVGSKQ